MKDDEHGVPAGSVGTARHDAPVTRDELERALRRAALATEGVRDDVIQLALALTGWSISGGTGPDSGLFTFRVDVPGIIQPGFGG